MFFVIFICLCFSLVSCKKAPVANKIEITTSNVNQYFKSHVEVYESGYGFDYELTVTPKVNVKNVDLYLEVQATVSYTYTMVGQNYPVFNGTQSMTMPVTLSSSGRGSLSRYKGTGTNILQCSLYVVVTYTNGTIELV